MKACFAGTSRIGLTQRSKTRKITDMFDFEAFALDTDGCDFTIETSSFVSDK